MIILYLTLLLAQDQRAEAKKLLDAVVPLNQNQNQNQTYVQLVCDTAQDGSVSAHTKTIYFKRGKAYRIDKPGQPLGFDGTRYWIYQKVTNDFRWFKTVPFHDLLSTGGVLAELCMYGTADRILKEAKKVTVVREPLDSVPCSHITISLKGRGPDVHVWIDGKNRVLRNHFKSADENSIMTYKFVDPPATDESLFIFTPPPDAKDLTTPDDR